MEMVGNHWFQWNRARFTVAYEFDVMIEKLWKTQTKPVKYVDFSLFFFFALECWPTCLALHWKLKVTLSRANRKAFWQFGWRTTIRRRTYAGHKLCTRYIAPCVCLIRSTRGRLRWKINFVSPRYSIWMSKFQWKNICTEDMKNIRTQRQRRKKK